MYLENLRSNVKRVCIFHLIFVGIPSSLILSVKNGVGDRQNLIRMIRVIFQWSLTHLVTFVYILYCVACDRTQKKLSFSRYSNIQQWLWSVSPQPPSWLAIRGQKNLSISLTVLKVPSQKQFKCGISRSCFSCKKISFGSFGSNPSRERERDRQRQRNFRFI